MQMLLKIVILSSIFSTAEIYLFAEEAVADTDLQKAKNEELLLNPDFEDPIGWDNWWCSGCYGQWTTQSFSGSRAHQTTERLGS